MVWESWLIVAYLTKKGNPSFATVIEIGVQFQPLAMLLTAAPTALIAKLISGFNQKQFPHFIKFYMHKNNRLILLILYFCIPMAYLALA